MNDTSMNRREFFNKLADPATYAATAETQPTPPVIIESICMPTAGSPRQYKRGSLVFVQDVQAWLGYDDGGFYAIDAICPHLGCVVKQTQHGFLCPGHGRQYDQHGMLQQRPAVENTTAGSSLRYLYIDLDGHNNLVIRRDKFTTAADRFIA